MQTALKTRNAVAVSQPETRPGPARGAPRGLPRFLEIDHSAEWEADEIAGMLTGERPVRRLATCPIPGGVVGRPPDGSTGEGEPLARTELIQAGMGLGADFSAVRIHADAGAAFSARAVNANAYTAGEHIIFGEGRYAPGTHGGDRLLAHELAHIVHLRVHPSQSILRQESPAAPAQDSRISTPALEIHWDPQRPWTFSVEGNPTPSAIAVELYGFDMTEIQEFRKAWIIEGMMRAREGYEAIPELLRPVYQEIFYRNMDELLRRDVNETESILLQVRIGGSDEGRLISTVRWWSERKDLRARSGSTYFDAFLLRLGEDEWYTNYFLWKGKSSSFLDKLYTEVEERKGELHGLIARNSIVFGGYEPGWAAVETAARGERPTAPEPNAGLVDKSARLVLNALEGVTTGADSRIIADTLTSLSPREQEAVLRRLLRRFEDYGEAWQTGMLYWLFEDLTAEDRKRVANSLTSNGVLDPAAANALVGGRGWGGKYLPYTTRKGEEAAEYWADVYVRNEGPKAWGAAVAGAFASLWTPETAGQTAVTLGTASLGGGVSRAFPRVGQGLAVAGVGLSAYSTTISVQEVLTSHDPYTGRALSDEDKIAAVLQGVSGLLMLGAGFATAVRMPVGGGTALETMRPRTLVGSPEGGYRAPSISWKVWFNAQRGEYIAVGTNPASGEYAVVRINPQTGNGVAVRPLTGEVIPISGGRLQALPALPAGTPVASSITPTIPGTLAPRPIAGPLPQVPPTLPAPVLPPSVVLNPATGAPAQLSGTVSVGPAYRTFEEAFANKPHPGAHIAEVVLHDAEGTELARWWEVSESTGVGRTGDTEQKALVRVRLRPGQVLEIHGWFAPCTISRGCDFAMQIVAETSGAEIVYRTSDGRIFHYPRSDF